MLRELGRCRRYWCRQQHVYFTRSSLTAVQQIWLVNMTVQQIWLVNTTFQQIWLVNTTFQQIWLVNTTFQQIWLVNTTFQQIWFAFWLTAVDPLIGLLFVRDSGVKHVLFGTMNKILVVHISVVVLSILLKFKVNVFSFIITWAKCFLLLLKNVYLNGKLNSPFNRTKSLEIYKSFHFNLQNTSLLSTISGRRTATKPITLIQS